MKRLLITHSAHAIRLGDNLRYWVRFCAVLVVRQGATDPGRRYYVQSNVGGHMQGVYFIQMAQFVKIGYSSNIEKRLDCLRTGMPLAPVLLGVIEGVTEVRERQIHRKFSGLRQQGEWFEIADKIKDYIAKFATHRPEKIAEINHALVFTKVKSGARRRRRRQSQRDFMNGLKAGFPLSH